MSALALGHISWGLGFCCSEFAHARLKKGAGSLRISTVCATSSAQGSEDQSGNNYLGFLGPRGGTEEGWREGWSQSRGPPFRCLLPQYSQSRSLGAGQISCEVGGAQSSQTLLLAGWSTILQGGSCSVWREPPSLPFQYDQGLWLTEKVTYFPESCVFSPAPSTLG